MPRRWTSRKFLLTLATQIAALAVVFWPEHEAVIVEAARAVAGIAALVLSALGYLAAEASIDRAGKTTAPMDHDEGIT